MRVSKKSIVGAILTLTVLVGGTSYALFQSKHTEQKNINHASVQEDFAEQPKAERADQTQIESPTTSTEPVVTQSEPTQRNETVTQDTATAEPTKPRTYEQLLEAYGYSEYKMYMDKLKAKFPERFMPNMIEDSFAYIKRVYANPMGAQNMIEKVGWNVRR